MTHEQARQYMRENADQVLQRDGTGKGFICPVCNSGTGRHGTGIQQKDDKIHYTCFANNCFSNADIIDILAIADGIEPTDYMEAFNNALRYFNITVEDTPNRERTERKQTKREAEPVSQEQTKTDYTNYYKQCNADVGKTDYWQKRGITDDTIKRFMLGYDVNHNAVVIPIDKHAYKTRRTDRKQFYNSKGGTMRLYNPKALNNEVVYICESETDTLSIEQLGKPSVAIRGTSNTELIRDYITDNETPTETVILCLDNDEPGTTATEKIKTSLEPLGIACIDIRPMFNNYKDINEMLTADQEALKGILTLTVNELKEAIQGILRHEYVKQNSATAFINEFINGISESVNTPPIATGFENLDNYFNGGLREGLYTIGAVTSLGKSTFIIQIADHIAKQGTDVIIFALEMNKAELMAKSFSRNTFTYCITNGVNINPYAKSNINITDGTKYANYNDQERHIITQAIKDYQRYSDHIYIYENHTGGTLGIADIERIVKQHHEATGNRPVVFLDYLQLLAPPQERLTDKQVVDQHIVRLKALSNTYKIPVIVISSLNRDNADLQFSNRALKESGNIEYTSNAVIGLQFKGVGKKDFDIKTAMQKNPRSIELVVTKNRHGQTGGTINYEYYPQFNYFEEA